MALNGMEMLGKAWLGQVRRVVAVLVWSGAVSLGIVARVIARLGGVRQGSLGQVGRGWVRCCPAFSVVARRGSHGWDPQGWVVQDMAWLGRAAKAGLGVARLTKGWTAWLVVAWQSRLGRFRLGLFWRRPAMPGVERFGMTR